MALSKSPCRMNVLAFSCKVFGSSVCAITETLNKSMLQKIRMCFFILQSKIKRRIVKRLRGKITNYSGVNHMGQQSIPELRFKPGGFGGHHRSTICNIKQLLNTDGI